MDDYNCLCKLLISLLVTQDQQTRVHVQLEGGMVCPVKTRFILNSAILNLTGQWLLRWAVRCLQAHVVECVTERIFLNLFPFCVSGRYSSQARLRGWRLISSLKFHTTNGWSYLMSFVVSIRTIRASQYASYSLRLRSRIRNEKKKANHVFSCVKTIKTPTSDSLNIAFREW